VSRRDLDRTLLVGQGESILAGQLAANYPDDALRFFPSDGQTGNYCRRIGVGLGVGEELSVSLVMKITNSDGCRVWEVIDREETLVATG
jgi:hypothetical protein